MACSPVPGASPAGPLLRFALATTGCFYVLMTVSLVNHEVVGHGVVAWLLGGEFTGFQVSTGFAGWAAVHDVPEGSRWIVRYGGIGVNLLLGLSALAFAWGRPALSAGAYPVFWLAVTHTGQGLGYLVSGMLFRRGDAACLPDVLGPLHPVALAILAAAFAVFCWWSLRRLVGYAHDQLRPASAAGRRAGAFFGFALPLVLLILLVATDGPFETWQRLSFNGGVVVLMAAACWILGSRPPVRRAGDPTWQLGWGCAVAWSAAGAAVVAVTALWTSRGVSFGS